VVLFAGCLVVLRPFVSTLLWAVILCFATWPVYQRLLGWVRNRRSLAAILMTFAMVLIVLLPFVVIGMSLADNVRDFTVAARHWIDEGPPAPPEWLGKVPIIGQNAVEKWQSLAQDTSQLWAASKKWIEPVSAGLLRVALGAGRGLVELALSIFIAFFLFRDAPSFVKAMNAAVHRIGGERGGHLLTVAGNTVRGVVYGILGTALVQAIVAGFGYLIAGVPGVALLVLLTFFSSIVPVVGTGLVWVPVALWLFHTGATGWAIFMIVWGLAIGGLDNVIKPWLISQGSDLPFLLIFFGVLGGALAFGFIGVFLGPTLLSVGYKLVVEWYSATTAAPPKAEVPNTG
jgi:predicted PurR-regulated permease PerM